MLQTLMDDPRQLLMRCHGTDLAVQCSDCASPGSWLCSVHFAEHQQPCILCELFTSRSEWSVFQTR